MLHYVLNPLQIMCIQIQIQLGLHIPCFSSWKLIKVHRKRESKLEISSNMKTANEMQVNRFTPIVTHPLSNRSYKLS
jgi:hypothetical protein